jgi:hypothetical protein
MKINKKIFLYLDNQLSDSQRNQFERELQNSPELFAQFEKYKNLLKGFSDLKYIEADENYFVNLIPRFREKIANKKVVSKKAVFIPEFALVVTSVVAISVLLFFTLLNNKNNNLMNLQSITSQISSEDIDETLGYYGSNLVEPLDTSSLDLSSRSDSLIDNALVNEILTNNDNKIENYLVNDDVNYSTLIKDVNPENIELIYAKLKNKRYF